MSKSDARPAADAAFAGPLTSFTGGRREITCGPSGQRRSVSPWVAKASLAHTSGASVCKDGQYVAAQRNLSCEAEHLIRRGSGTRLSQENRLDVSAIVTRCSSFLASVSSVRGSRIGFLNELPRLLTLFLLGSNLARCTWRVHLGRWGENQIIGKGDSAQGWTRRSSRQRTQRSQTAKI